MLRRGAWVRTVGVLAGIGVAAWIGGESVAMGAALVGFLLLAATPREAQADVKLASVFSDGMVLQRDRTLAVWGTADAGESVSVSLAGNQAQTAADGDGAWSVHLPAAAAGGPHELVAKGKNAITLKDVLVGEVWVCSGQSNMQWPLSESLNAAEEIAAADHPTIRLLQVPATISDEPLANLSMRWQPCSPSTIPNFSAVGYFFGRKLNEDLGVPVGLINSSWGGTCSEAWTSRESLAPEFPALLARQHGLDDPNKPTVLFNGMVSPLLPLTVRGAIWYQGESNADRGYQYRSLFRTLIRDWRHAWGDPDFAFFFVQLANFGEPLAEPGDNHWAELREAQLMALAEPRTGMAVAIDIGEANDIHPRNKQDVGKRLALSALAGIYGRDVVSSGPLYDGCIVEQGKARVRFQHVDGGLKTSDGKALRGFAIASEDRRFVWADAVIDGNAVVVSSPDVAHPAAVRYGWHHNPDVNLVNSAGLPASPFRTDDWHGLSPR